MKLIPFALFLTLTVGSIAFADLSLRIIDAPETVWIYAPVYITAELRNEGKDSVLLAVNENEGNGWSFDIISPEGRRRYSTGFITDHFGDAVVWLKPGESYYFQTDVSHGHEQLKAGTFQIEAILSGAERCRIITMHPMEPEFASAPNRCWSGEVRSQPVTVIVTPPTLEKEQQILEEILAGKYCEYPCSWSPLSHSYPKLKQLSPDSYYTMVSAFYAARAWIGGTSFSLMSDALQLQPHHPLSIYAEMNKAIGAIFQATEPQYEERLAPIIPTQLPVPAALQRYIEFKQREQDQWIVLRRAQRKGKAKVLWD